MEDSKRAPVIVTITLGILGLLATPAFAQERGDWPEHGNHPHGEGECERRGPPPEAIEAYRASGVGDGFAFEGG